MKEKATELITEQQIADAIKVLEQWYRNDDENHSLLIIAGERIRDKKEAQELGGDFRTRQSVAGHEMQIIASLVAMATRFSWFSHALCTAAECAKKWEELHGSDCDCDDTCKNCNCENKQSKTNGYEQTETMAQA